MKMMATWERVAFLICQDQRDSGNLPRFENLILGEATFGTESAGRRI